MFTITMSPGVLPKPRVWPHNSGREKLLFNRKKPWTPPQSLKKDPNLWAAKEKSGIERTKERGPLLLHCQQGPVALVHLPLHYTHSPSAYSLLSCVLFFPSAFHLVCTHLNIISCCSLSGSGPVWGPGPGLKHRAHLAGSFLQLLWKPKVWTS